MSDSSERKMVLPNDQDASGRSFDHEELEQLRAVLDSGTLTCTKGSMVRELEHVFAEKLGIDRCRAASSGTAAIHAAVAAIDPAPGDEIVTTPITDMGGITPILYQSAIPVFADVDPRTYNVTAETIEPKLTRRTKAVMVTHLFGNPCEMDAILELCRGRGIPVIEDCAQAYGAMYRGRPVGTLGDIGCFSLQQGKHITAGEGGLVVTHNEHYGRRIRLFIDKAWGYGDPKPDHYFLALNYRMNELSGAVSLAQMGKLDGNVAQRVAMARRLDAALAEVPGVEAPHVEPHAVHGYWRYALRVDPAVLRGGAVALGDLLRERGVFCAPRYIQKPAFECQVLRDQVTFGNSRFPFVGPQREGEPEIRYDRADTPGTIEALERVVVLPWNERYREDHVDYVAAAIQAAAERLATPAAAGGRS